MRTLRRSLGVLRRRRPPWLPLALLGAAVVLLLLGCVLVFPRYLVDRDLGGISPSGLSASERLKATNDVRTTLLQGLAGAFFLATAFFTWRQIRISQRQLQLSEDQQVADRFARAIEQLAKHGLDLRLGGLYGLEQIANTSHVYCEIVAEVVAAYIRQHAVPAPLPLDATPAPLSEDVQAALTILGRSVGPRMSGRRPINLNGIVLAGANLREAVLPHVNFSRSILSKAHLEAAQLTNARLVDAHLDGARLINTNLSGHSKLINTNLAGARLIEADLSGADLTGAAVDAHTRLIGTNLQGARLRYVALGVTRYGHLVSDDKTEWPADFVPRDE